MPVSIVTAIGVTPTLTILAGVVLLVVAVTLGVTAFRISWHAEREAQAESLQIMRAERARLAELERKAEQ